jgi:3-hydroxyacyl-CoA dehydrogenase
MNSNAKRYKTMPRPTPAQKELRHDKAVIRAEVAILRNPGTNEAAKAKAVETISRTVLHGTKLSASGDTPKLLADLAATLDPGSVALSGVDVAIENAAAKLDIPKSELDTIPEVVKQRLDKLV